MAKTNHPDPLTHYLENGYAILRGFVGGDDLTRLRQETAGVRDAGLQHHKTYRDGNLAFEILPEEDFGTRYILQAYWFSWINAWFEEFRRSERYRALLTPLLGPDIKQMAQQIHWKPPGARITGFRYHQDIRFRKETDHLSDPIRDSLTVGVAIDPCTIRNGCLRVFPGSHKMGYLGLSDDGSGVIMTGLTAEEELRMSGLDPGSAIDVELAPGDAVIWGLMTVHGSLPNESDMDRAFSISSYVRASASPNRGEWAFRNGVSTPLGDHPVLCKDDGLLTRTGPTYEDSRWYAAALDEKRDAG
ncbi:MAG: phytanoyl-CoA dioxygenase family protein [Alphaproteobacteria bacterium]